jgi:hypothetical protein
VYRDDVAEQPQQGALAKGVFLPVGDDDGFHVFANYFELQSKRAKIK